MNGLLKLIIFYGIILTLLLSSCTAQNLPPAQINNNIELISDVSSEDTVTFTLQTLADSGKLLYIGKSECP